MSNRLVATCAMISCIIGGAKLFLGLLLLSKVPKDAQDIWSNQKLSYVEKCYKILKIIS